MPLPLGEVSPKVTERAHPLPCGELPPQRLRGLQIGEARKKCNGDDRRQRRIQGGAVGAAVSRTRVPLKARSGRWAPQPVGSSASKSPCPCRAKHTAFASQTGLRLKSPTGAFMPSGHRRPFWFSFGAKREQSPPGSSASKSPCPCRAEHTAFASQTGLRLKSPTGAFMPSGHRRPFWFSFVRQKRTSSQQTTLPSCSSTACRTCAACRP